MNLGLLEIIKGNNMIGWRQRGDWLGLGQAREFFPEWVVWQHWYL